MLKRASEQKAKFEERLEEQQVCHGDSAQPLASAVVASARRRCSGRALPSDRAFWHVHRILGVGCVQWLLYVDKLWWYSRACCCTAMCRTCTVWAAQIPRQATSATGSAALPLCVVWRYSSEPLSREPRNAHGC